MSDLVERAFRRHYGQVYRFLRRRTGDEHRAEELAQQVFADAAAGLSARRDGDDSPLPWLYTVAKRRFADEARWRGRDDAALRRAVVRAPPVEYGPGVSMPLRAALKRLPPSQRDVLVLKLLRGATFAEIADMLGISQEAGKMRFVRGLATVRDELRKEGIEP